ncbi:MAG: CotH kinase family protein, partial [Bacteroidota bacterium]
QEDSILAFDIPTIDLLIDEKAQRKLDQKREASLVKGLLTQGENDWVKAKMVSDEAVFPVKMRLKGDLVSHFHSAKLSYRIALKAPHAWKRMITFSLHSPVARGFLDEWLYHKLLEQEDVLTTKYDFVHLKLNGKSLGLYAYEEHFEKHLVESRARREGPIVKYDERGVWAVRQQGITYRTPWQERETYAFEAAHAAPFKESRIINDSSLARQFDLAHTLLEQFRMGEAQTSEIFDADRLARFFALTDVSRAYHGLIWHNQRFYYNPVIGKLEPVGFDGFTEKGAFEWWAAPFLGARNDGQKFPLPRQNHIPNLFRDQDFARAYYRYLDQFTRKNFWDQFLAIHEGDWQMRYDLIKTEFPEYEEELRGFARHAHKLRTLLFPVGENAVKVFTQKVEGKQKYLAAVNYHMTPLEVVAWGKKTKAVEEEIEAFYLPGAGQMPLQRMEGLQVPKAAKALFVRIPGVDSLFAIDILPWSLSAPTTPVQRLMASAKVENNERYVVQDSLIQFLPGKHRITEDIIIPKGYRVLMDAGTEWDLVQGAKFLSQSPLHFTGTEAEPIVIRSSDRSAGGFTVLQTNDASVLKSVIFDGLNTLSTGGWQLTGSVTFYEANVRLYQCRFLNSPCEDGLNLVRSRFKMSQCLIQKTFSDGFDADFCQGEVILCRFVETGNDGMDFSGSKITVRECQVDGAGDKGLSAGEESTIRVFDMKVANSNTGVASKDLSLLIVEGLDIQDCRTGFAAYQKKPEYGPASIEAKKVTTSGLTHRHLIEKGSKLTVDEQAVEGI